MATGKPYTLFKRNDVYYARFKLPNGKRSIAKSTGETSKGRAEQWCLEYLQTGKIIIRENVTLRAFAGDDFFNIGNTWETNKRIAGKKAPSPRWCLERTDMLKNHIIPALGDYRLTLINEDVITTFRNDLYNGIHGRKYSGAFINKILFALRDILKAAYKKNLIQAIPEFELAGVIEKKRGRLTQHEAGQLFSFQWSDERAFIASLIAAGTGMRLSEIQALTVNDIQPDGKIIICKAWEWRTQTVKERTKSGKDRIIQLSRSHHARILKFLQTHPFRDCQGFLLYSEVKKDVPASSTTLTRPFHNALEKIGIDKSSRQQRGICFHSWRYYCNSVLIEAGVPDVLIREVIGHTQEAMTRRYFKSENTESIQQAMETALPLYGENENLKIN